MKTELISRILLAIVAFYLISKVIGPFIFNIIMDQFGPGNKKKKDIDLDVLIEKKKLMMQRGNPSAKNNTTSSISEKYSSRLEASFSKEFKKLNELESSDSRDRKLKSIKSVLTLLDNLQWGEGKVFKELSEDLQKQGFEINQMLVSKSVKRLVEKNTYLTIARPELPSFNEIKTATKTYIYLKNLFEQVNMGGETLVNLSKELGYKSNVIKHSIILNLAKVDSSNKIKNLELNIKKEVFIEEVEEKAMSLILTKDKKAFQSHLSFIDNLKEDLELISLVLPIPTPKDKKDIKSSFSILGLREDSSLDVVKKKYKKFAIKMHPDKLLSLKLSPELEKTAVSNFNIIKDAYDIIIEQKQ